MKCEAFYGSDPEVFWMDEYLLVLSVKTFTIDYRGSIYVNLTFWSCTFCYNVTPLLKTFLVDSSVHV